LLLRSPLFALLVFDQDAAHAQSLVEPDHAHHAFDIAITVVAVGEERQRRGRGDVPNAVAHVGQADEADVRQPVASRQHGGAADRERAKAGAGDQACGQHVVRERGHERTLRRQRFAQWGSGQWASRGDRKQFEAGDYTVARDGR
jgi:hypothetical protein